jgi:hypothetical protein
MHTEHLQNVRPGRVLAGWLVAIAVTSFVVFGFVLLGLIGQSAAADTLWTMTAVAAGFLVGGWFTGYGTLEAPILHGIALGLTSLLAWVVVNAVVVVGFRGAEWEGLTATAALGVILTQMLAGVVGCWVGVRGARIRATELSSTPATGVRGRDEESLD